MHHKRKGPKSTRAGCLLCKPHKQQGAPLKDRQRHSAVKGLATHADDVPRRYSRTLHTRPSAGG